VIEVVRLGRLEFGQRYFVGCTHCGTTFYFHEADGRAVDHGTASANDVIAVRCPLCRHEIWMDRVAARATVGG
jgi:phage terminase large subunit GpA-like protein